MFENWGMIKDEKENRHNETPQKNQERNQIVDKNKLTILIDPYYNILYVYSICIRKISQMTRWSDYIISRAPVFLFQALKIQLYLVFRLVRSMN